MNARRLASIALALAAGLAGCASAPRVGAPPATVQSPPRSAAPPLPPGHLLEVPDAIPRIEPRAIYGNPPSYEVFGKRYYVMASSVGYVERGVASWYGPGFHKELTSVREPYDMYGMTAAHKTLPLPAYVRVTNLQNGRSCVVRVNDRGPFVGNRIIDLSYTAAAAIEDAEIGLIEKSAAQGIVGAVGALDAEARILEVHRARHRDLAGLLVVGDPICGNGALVLMHLHVAGENRHSGRYIERGAVALDLDAMIVARDDHRGGRALVLGRRGTDVGGANRDGRQQAENGGRCGSLISLGQIRSP